MLAQSQSSETTGSLIDIASVENDGCNPIVDE